jgi:iron complex outermembrane receptor protein
VPRTLFLLVFLVASSAASGATLRGRVTDPRRQPVAGATVTTGTVQARTDSSGSFAMDLPEGRHLVLISAPSFGTEARTVDLRSAMDLDVALRPAVAATLTVVAEISPETQRVAGGTAVVSEEEIRQTRAHNLEDVLAFVPGVSVQSRFGADESQLSVRGSGLRNNFHLRGINLLINGIPYQDADGFSDFETVDLLATERLQVWKGANALQYGGSSMGGAINLVTFDGATAPALSVRVAAGSFGLMKAQIAAGRSHGDAGFYASLSHSKSDGYRDWSEQRRLRFFGNAGFRLGSTTSVRVDAIYADVSEQLPGSLSADQFRDAPERADPTNQMNRWGRDFAYTRLAVQFSRVIGTGGEASVYVFGQTRDMVHPIFQILDQDALNSGAEASYRMRTAIGGRANRIVAGATALWGGQDEDRFENAGGQRGALAGRFATDTTTYAVYAENQLEMTPSVVVTGGARADWSRRAYDDRFPADGDRSDVRTFRSISPRLGVLWNGPRGVQLFANASRSYEPPLVLELTSFGSPGFLDLDAQSTWQYEIGSRSSGKIGWDVALYDAEIDNEIINVNALPFPGAPFTIPSFRNARRTRHRGAELGVSGRIGANWSGRAAYTWSDFRFVDDGEFGGNRLPGAAPHALRAQLRFDAARGWIAPSVEWSPASYFADSANIRRNDPYGVVNLHGGVRWRSVEVIAEIANVTDEHYSASVQVDNAAGRFLEPAAPRSASINLRWSMERR